MLGLHSNLLMLGAPYAWFMSMFEVAYAGFTSNLYPVAGLV